MYWQDILIAPCWLGVNLLLGSAAWQAARFLFPEEGILQRLMHVLVVCWACIVVSGLVLGLVGILGGNSMLILVALLALGMRFGLRRAAKGDVPPTPPPIEVVERACVVLWFGVFSCWAGHVIAAGLGVFPSDWDTLMYHLPLVDQWLQAGSLYASDSSHWYNPGNNELVALWMVAPFSGDFLYALNNLPASILLAVACLEVAGSLGISRLMAHLFALVSVSHVVLLRQLVDNENDVAVAAMFMATLAYAFRWTATESTGDLVLAALAVGLLAGIKYYALGYAAIAGGTMVLATLLYRGLGPGIRAALGLSAGCMACCAYWYIRNWWISGSPIYPQGLPFGHDPLAEIYPDVWGTTFFGNGSAELSPLAAEAVRDIAGPCQFAALLGVPLTFACLLGSGIGDRRRGMLAVALLGAGLVLGVTPFAVETTPGTLDMLRAHYLPVRFGLCFLSLATLALLVVIDDIRQGLGARPSDWLWREKIRPVGAIMRLLSWLPVLGAACAASSQLYFGISKSVRLAPSLYEEVGWGANLLVWGVVGRTLWCGCRTRWRACRGIAGGLMLAGLVAVTVGRLTESWHGGFCRHYREALSLESFRAAGGEQPGTECWCVLDYRIYPFFGSRRQSHVCQPVYTASFSALARYLGEHEVRRVIVVKRDPFLFGRYRDAYDRLMEQPGAVALVSDRGPVAVFEVRNLRP